MEGFKEWYMAHTKETEEQCNLLDNPRYADAYHAWQAATERAAGIAETTAEDIRKANTYRGKVNQMAGEAAGWIDRLAAVIRKG